MDRRKSIKALLVGSVSAGVLVEACTTEEKKVPSEHAAAPADVTPAGSINRMKEEAEHQKEVDSEKTFFTAEEMATITILGDIIIPKDETSGSASDAKVPAFIEFIVKDEPVHQLPMRGGLRWLDIQCLNRYDKDFIGCTPVQRTAILDEIAYPMKAKPEMQQGVVFFNKIRDLAAIGFFTSKMGIEDLGYKGNSPGKWEGVPPEVLKQYGLENV